MSLQRIHPLERGCRHTHHTGTEPHQPDPRGLPSPPFLDVQKAEIIYQVWYAPRTDMACNIRCREGRRSFFFAPRCFGDQLRIVTVIPNPPGPLRISPDHLKCPSQIRLQALPPPSLHTAATSTSGCGTPTPDEHHSTLSFAASVAGRRVSAALAKHRTLPPISSGLVTSLCFWCPMHSV